MKKSKKTEALILQIVHAASEILFAAGDKGCTRAELLKKLQLEKYLVPFFEEALEELLERGQVEIIKSHFVYVSLAPRSVEGVLSVHPRGFGFVKTATTPDIFVASEDMFGAIDGDLVEVLPSQKVSEKGPDGKILRVIERKRKFLVAHVIQPLGNQKKKYMAFIPILGKDRFAILHTKEPLSYGERVVMSIETVDTVLEGNFQKSLGKIEEASKDIDVAIEEYLLIKKFSEKAIQEAKKKTIEEKDLQGRKDLRRLNCMTIDPKTAKDFDDAISIEKDAKKYRLGVHIADVAHFVKVGSELDKEAFQRSNSTYFPKNVIPMLPFELSSDLCSLRPGRPRLTMSIFMDFDFNGNLLSYEILRSVIESKQRFSYPEALDILQKKEKSPFANDLWTMQELALLLKAKRTERGSFDFAIPEACVEVDQAGNPLHIVVHEYDVSHQIIEEFMLKANEVVAKHLSDTKKMSIYRIHESPTEESLESFFSFARALGLELSKKPSHEEMQKLFKLAAETPYGNELAIQYIRSMKLAFYSPDNIGHYGLALEYYTHFTSPIRRYSDLVIQRLLFDEPIENDLEKVAEHCSEKERISMKAEQSVLFLKKLRLLAKSFRKDPHHVYPALVTAIKPFGLFFQVKDFYLEGFLHISSFDTYMIFDKKFHTLQSETTGFAIKLGDTIFVKITKISLPTLSVEWEISPE